jgi:hypothetical protein
MSFVRILTGVYRKEVIADQTFELVKGFQSGVKGGFITVKNNGTIANGGPQIRVRVESLSDFEFINKSATMHTEPKVEVDAETDQQAMDRIATRFQILDEMSSACINGGIRAMIVTGPPGVGKSHGVTMQMEKASLFDKIAGKRPRFEIIKGAISGIGLFATLYKYSDSQNVLVFDDCDVWEDSDAINVLKGALDSGKTRRISWNKDSRMLRDEAVPNTFDFHGSIIFITNSAFDNKRASKIQPHLDALQSRCHFLDLTVNTERDKILRIKQVHRDADGGLFAAYDFTQEQCDQIIDFMCDNQAKIREISMRMALKIADLVKISPDNWKVLAKATCVKP